MSAFTDCLVLRIEEIDNDYEVNSDDESVSDSDDSKHDVINTVYIIYDSIKEQYFICGKNKNNECVKYISYHFYCSKIKHLLNYISLTITNKTNISLYNLNNLPDSCDDLNYYFLDKMSTETHKLIDYDDIMDINDKSEIDLKNLLKMMKHVKNDYIII